MKVLLAVDGSTYTKKMLAYLTTHEELMAGTHDRNVDVEGLLRFDDLPGEGGDHRTIYAETLVTGEGLAGEFDEDPGPTCGT